MVHDLLSNGFVIDSSDYDSLIRRVEKDLPTVSTWINKGFIGYDWIWFCETLGEK